jgi:hypothetical protein
MRRRYRKNKYTPYADLPPRKRRDAFVDLRGKILRDTPIYGGKFTSHQVLDEPGRPDLFNQWFDFLFLGLDGRTIWNAEIITARRSFWDEVDSLTWDRVTALMSEEERAAEFRLDFEPVPDGRRKMYRIRPRERPCYTAFGGLTFKEYEEQVAAEIIRENPPAIHERFITDRSYRYGIGLHIVVDADALDQAVVAAAIERFNELGEIDWSAPRPVPRAKLPLETEARALAKLRAGEH